MSALAIIVAYNQERVIGKQGDLPWHYKEDLRFFRRTTMGHHIIMGRKTWQSIGKALPGRVSIVLTRDRSFVAPGAHVVHSMEEALQAAKEDSCPMIIGGEGIYRQAIPIASRIYATEVVHEVAGGDVFFPELDSSWREERRQKGQHPNLSFVVFVREPPR